MWLKTTGILLPFARSEGIFPLTPAHTWPRAKLCHGKSDLTFGEHFRFKQPRDKKKIRLKLCLKNSRLLLHYRIDLTEIVTLRGYVCACLCVWLCAFLCIFVRLCLFCNCVCVCIYFCVCYRTSIKSRYVYFQFNVWVFN